MPTITLLPHESLCPDGISFEAPQGSVLLRELLARGIEVEHACELSCACTTCHVVVREGFDSLANASDEEEDMLDRAWGLTARSRLSCQVRVGARDLVVELPRYTINHAREEH